MGWIAPRRLPILARLLIANGLVVVVGASIGTLLTKALVEASAFALAVIFTAAGVALSLALNYVVLRIALRPLSDLTSTVDEIRDGHLAARAPVPATQDPDITRLTDALNAMLERLAAHTATIDANREQLRALSAQVITAQEEERKRIARELHDETSQSLASLLIALERIDGAIPEDRGDLKRRLQAARELAAETLDGLRVLVADLRPLLLDDLGLIPAIRWYARQHLESQGIDVEFHLPDNLPRLPPPAETALFRIAQEAINNVVKHADASQVTICLCCQPGLPAPGHPEWHATLELTVEDDGVGFDPGGAARNGQHFGLFGMRERAAALGGSLTIDSTPGAGTHIQMRLPV